MQPLISDYLARIGARGGTAGKGKRKRITREQARQRGLKAWQTTLKRRRALDKPAPPVAP